MTDTAVRASPVAWIRHRLGERWPRTYAVALILGLLLAFTGAMGTGESFLGARIAYWLLLMLGGTMIAHLAGAFLDRLNLGLWPQIGLMLIVITPVIAAYAWAVTGLFEGGRFDPQRWPVFVAPSFAIALAMSVLHTQINRTPAQSHAYAEPRMRAPGAALRERLPFKYRDADIFALTAEDHYLRVHTSAGETLILMRLSDAIRELDGVEGSQTHRSWWAAKAAVADVARGDGRASLTLKNGLCVPVSRSYVKALKQDGWL